MAAVGAVVMVIGLALAARSALLLAGRGRPRRGPQPSFVLAGPYLRMRNPLTAGCLLALTGAALASGSWWVALAAGLAAVGAHSWIVRVEEPRLRARFGDAYAVYLRRVPRWLPRRLARG